MRVRESSRIKYGKSRSRNFIVVENDFTFPPWHTRLEVIATHKSPSKSQGSQEPLSSSRTRNNWIGKGKRETNRLNSRSPLVSGTSRLSLTTARSTTAGDIRIVRLVRHYEFCLVSVKRIR